MTEYALNHLTPTKLAELAFSSATFLAVVARAAVKLELYYLDGYFIELCHTFKKRSGQPTQWRLYSANHFPDVPESTKYLSIYLKQIELPGHAL